MLAVAGRGSIPVAGVVAVEAFDLAGSRTAFPEQVSAPRYNRGIANYGEGLRPWQPKKLYFFSDAAHPEFLKGRGPTYLATDISRAKKVPFSAINREGWKDYSTQVDFDEQALHSYTDSPEYLVLGKSLVKSAIDADVFAGVEDKPAAYSPPAHAPEPAPSGITFTLGGPWSFYQQFYRVHDLASLSHLVTPPQTALSSERQLWVPLLLRNDTAMPQDITVHQDLPEGWNSVNPPGVYHLDPGESWPVQLFFIAASYADSKLPQILRWTALIEGKAVGGAELSVYLEYNGVPQ
jgi:hypothetical protein